MANMRIPVGEATELPTLGVNQIAPGSIPAGTTRVGRPRASLRVPRLPDVAPPDPFAQGPIPAGQVTEAGERLTSARNPSIIQGGANGPGRMSEEARQWMSGRNARVPAAIEAAAPGMKLPSSMREGFAGVSKLLNTPGAKALGGVAALGGAVGAGESLGNAIQAGDKDGMFNHGVDTVTRSIGVPLGMGAAARLYGGGEALKSGKAMGDAIDSGQYGEAARHGVNALGGSMLAGGPLPVQVAGGAMLGAGHAGRALVEHAPGLSDTIGRAVDKGMRAIGLGEDVYTGPQPSYQDPTGTQPAGAAGGGRGFVNPPPIATTGLPGNQTMRPSTGAGGGRGFVNPASVSPSAPLAAPGATLPAQGDIVKTLDAQGRTTYSGMGDVGAGARIVDPMGRVSKGAGVTSVPAETFAGGPTGLREALSGQPFSYGGGSDAEPAQTAPTIGGFSSSVRGNMRETPAVDPMDEIKSRGLNARGAGLLIQARGQTMGNETSRRGQDIGASTAAMGNDTARRGQDIGAATMLRGQDIGAATSMRGQDMNTQVARMQARQQQMLNDRQFGLDEQKFGHEKAKTMHAQREAAQKDFQSWAENQFPGEDGKPDMAKAADFAHAAQASLGGLIARLDQAGESAKAEKLRAEGFAGLDMEDRALLRTLYERRNVHAQKRGNWNPFSASGPVSNDLFDSVITGTSTANGFQERYTMAGGQSIGRNDLDYAGGANALTAPFSTPSTALRPTLREQQLMKQTMRSN